MEMVMGLVLALALGLVLGYWSVLLRVWRLERELAQETAVAEAWAKLPCLKSTLDSEWVWVQKSEWETVKVKQSELEMALDQAKSKAMGKD